VEAVVITMEIPVGMVDSVEVEVDLPVVLL
jgi:hypothetical protein